MPTSTNEITLSQPPIFEALIEIRFAPNKDVTLEQIEMLWTEIKEEYPIIEALNTYTNSMQLKDGIQTTDVNVAPAGFRFMNAKKNRIIIADFEKITVSYKAPYLPWPELRDKTKEILQNYLKNVKQTKIVRIGMRYINNIEINDSVDFDISKYTNTSPLLAVGEERLNQFSTFETFCIKHFDDIDCTSHIRQALVPALKDKQPNKGKFNFILDIDIFIDNLNIDVTSNVIWEFIDNMRTKRNLIFFGTMTEHALEPYK